MVLSDITIMQKRLSTIIMILILLFVLGVSPSGMEALGSISYENSNLESQVINNISIKGEEDLKEFANEEGLTGNGSEENPFLLENYTIDGTGENYSVFLDDIELHFVIRDCKIYNSSSAGVKINRVSNFTLENSVVKNVTDGISIESSENIMIKGSSIYDTTGEGVDIKSSENVIIKRSSIFENDKGIYLGEGANNNTITDNNISNNDPWGIHISESNHNLIYHNIFLENTIQAYDDGDNQWDDGERGGNYWSDYEDKYPEANESNGKGIWDTHYDILGKNNRDEHPLISPIGPPTNVRARPQRDEYVEITWDAPQYSIRYPIEEIILYRGKERDNLSVYEVLNSTAQSFLDENVTEDETYHYGLIASNEKYTSVMSEVQSAQPDTTRPEVQNVDPEGEDTPIYPTINVVFSEEMKADSIQIFMKDADGEEIELEEEEVIDDIEFNFVPKENLSYETRYEVSINGSDKASNWLESPYTWSFTTVSDTGIIIGRVVNVEEKPLDDVEIYVNEQNQAFTDSSGEFQLEVPSGNVTLEVSRDGYEDKEIDIHINQSEEKEIEDIMLREKEGIISQWFWLMALAGGGILLLGILALIISFYHWEYEEAQSDEDIYDVEYEEISAEEFESWWEDEDS